MSVPVAVCTGLVNVHVALISSQFPFTSLINYQTSLNTPVTVYKQGLLLCFANAAGNLANGL